MADNTTVSNGALGHIGAGRITDFTDDTATDVKTIWCRQYLEQARDALQRSHWWRFAKARVALSKVGEPPFEFDNRFALPADFLRGISVYDGSSKPDGSTLASWELEGKTLLANADSVNLRYIKRVEDPDLWDPLFAEVFELTLARKLVIPLSQDVAVLKKDIDKDLEVLLKKVRAMDRTEAKHIGREALKTWNDARWTNIP